jgi:hypothetical protein
MSAPIACPRCKSELTIRHKSGDYYCQTCQEWRSPEYIEACGRSTDLQAVQISLGKITIKPLRPGDRKLIRTLFDNKDVVYDGVHGRYVIVNIIKYAHIKCVQVASIAWLQQYKFLEVA